MADSLVVSSIYHLESPTDENVREATNLSEPSGLPAATATKVGKLLFSHDVTVQGPLASRMQTPMVEVIQTGTANPDDVECQGRVHFSQSGRVNISQGGSRLIMVPDGSSFVTRVPEPAGALGWF